MGGGLPRPWGGRGVCQRRNGEEKCGNKEGEEHADEAKRAGVDIEYLTNTKDQSTIRQIVRSSSSHL